MAYSYFRGPACSLEGVKLPWQKSEEQPEQQAEVAGEAASISEAQPEPTYPKGYTPPKGRPTPKRHEQEIKRGVIRDPDALTPAQRSQRNKDLKASMTKEEWKAYK